MISCDTHIIRKALRLSLNEMAVLCDIYQMGQNPNYGYWCVKSKDKMASWLDLSRDTIYRAISSLKQKGYVVSNEQGNLRCTQFIYNIETAQEEIAIWVKSNDTELISAKMSELMQSENRTPSENQITPSENQTMNSTKIRQTPSENQTLDIQEINSKINNREELYFFENKKQGKKSNMFVVPTLPQVEEYAKTNGFDSAFAKVFFDYYSRCEWTDAENKKVKNWKNKMQSWISREQNDKYRLDAKTGSVKKGSPGVFYDPTAGVYWKVWSKDGQRYECWQHGEFKTDDNINKIPYTG